MTIFYINNSGENKRLDDRVHIHYHLDRWSRTDTVFLVSMIATAIILCVVGELGINAYKGRGLLAMRNLPLQPYVIGVSVGAVLVGAVLVFRITKKVESISEMHRIKKMLCRQGAAPADLLEEQPLRLAETGELQYTTSKIDQYHILVSHENVHIYRSLEKMQAKANSLNLQYVETSQPEYIRTPKVSVMNLPSVIKTHESKLLLGAGIALTALSIAGFVIPFFVHFKGSNALQMVAVGALPFLAYGIGSALIAAKKSRSFINNGFDKNFRRLGSNDHPYLNALGVGMVRSLLLATIAAFGFALIGCTLDRFSINPLYTAPFVIALAAAIFAYTHFQAREKERVWENACANALDAKFDGEIQSQPRRFKGARFIRNWGNIVVDLSQVPPNERAAFLAAKKQYTMSIPLLISLVALIAIALIASRIILAKIPPKP